jgi:hypothetical protein
LDRLGAAVPDKQAGLAELAVVGMAAVVDLEQVAAAQVAAGGLGVELAVVAQQMAGLEVLAVA